MARPSHQKCIITLAYDGTHYFGWQKTKMGPSIQETLETATLQITQERVIAEAASRTDRGVHAKGQVVAFSLQNRWWDPLVLQKALNALLPQDIRVTTVHTASPLFHPTLQARYKEYHYFLCLGSVQNPAWRRYSWHFHSPVNREWVEEAASHLLGTHDFRTFTNTPTKNPICTLSSIRYTPLEGQRLRISLQGDRFLYKMVRNLVGTLLYIGCGKLPRGAIPSLLQAKDRKRAGMTAPPQGLFLHRVEYGEPTCSGEVG